MGSFIQTTLQPEVFWNALAAMGTLLAVAVALLWPIYNQYLRNNRLERLLEAEVRGNLKIIKNMTSDKPTELPHGQIVLDFVKNDALAGHINIHMWLQFRYELAGERVNRFAKLNTVTASLCRIVFRTYTQIQKFDFRDVCLLSRNK